jgi:hypothetical protein
MLSIVGIANAVEDATCFLFGVIKPSFFILDVVVSFVVGVANSISPSFASFSVSAVGLTGVTFVVSVVCACLLLCALWAVFVITSARIGGRFDSHNFLSFSRVSAMLVKVELHDDAHDSVSTAL